MGATPKGSYGLSYSLMQSFNAFLYQYIESFVFLKVARRGGYKVTDTPNIL